MQLTDTQIKKIKTKDNPYKVSDGGGLYLGRLPLVASSGDGATGTKASKK